MQASKRDINKMAVSELQELVKVWWNVIVWNIWYYIIKGYCTNIEEYCPSQYIILHSQARIKWYTARGNIFNINDPMILSNTRHLWRLLNMPVKVFIILGFTRFFTNVLIRLLNLVNVDIVINFIFFLFFKSCKKNV